MVRYDRTGAIKWTVTLDATTICDVRSIAMRGEDTVLAATTAGIVSASLGPCSVATSGWQDPVALVLEAGGQPRRVAHWSSAGANAQGWTLAPLADSSLVMAGIYGSEPSCKFDGRPSVSSA